MKQMHLPIFLSMQTLISNIPTFKTEKIQLTPFSLNTNLTKAFMATRTLLDRQKQ